jgi:hypothetical protein
MLWPDSEAGAALARLTARYRLSSTTSRDELMRILSDVDDAYQIIGEDATLEPDVQAVVTIDLDEAADALRASIRHLARGSDTDGTR